MTPRPTSRPSPNISSSNASPDPARTAWPDTARFALYYAPPRASAWWRAGCTWLGRDPESGETLPPPVFAQQTPVSSNADDLAPARRPLAEQTNDLAPARRPFTGQPNDLAPARRPFTRQPDDLAPTRRPPSGPPNDRAPIRRSLAELTGDARRYGWHGTLVAPFRLAPGVASAALLAAARAWAHTRTRFALPVEAAELGRFVALRPTDAASAQTMRVLASDALRTLAPLRAAPTPADLARRLETSPGAPLTARQRALLAEWGYPYVLDEFRFHMTLSAALDDARERDWLRQTWTRQMQPPGPLPIEGAALFVEPAPGEPFVLWQRVAFGPGARPADQTNGDEAGKTGETDDTGRTNATFGPEDAAHKFGENARRTPGPNGTSSPHAARRMSQTPDVAPGSSSARNVHDVRNVYNARKIAHAADAGVTAHGTHGQNGQNGQNGTRSAPRAGASPFALPGCCRNDLIRRSSRAREPWPMSERLIYVMGPSGAGKDALFSYARHRVAPEGVMFAHRYVTHITHITCAERAGENHVAFIRAEFDARAACGLLRCNGTATRCATASASKSTCGPRAHAARALERYPRMTLVHVEAAPDVLAARLAARGRENAQQIAARLARPPALALPPPARPERIDNSGRLEDAGRAFIAIVRRVTICDNV